MIIKTQPEEFQNYLTDTSGLFSTQIEKVILPESPEEVSVVMKSAWQSKTQVTISGNGTGTTGGRVSHHGIILATDKLNQIGKLVQQKNGTATLSVQAGVRLKDLQEFVLDSGYLYPPDPTERNAFIGGTIATNASGSRTFKYGATRDWVQSIQVVLPDGTITTINRGDQKAKNGQLVMRMGHQTITITIPTYEMPLTKHAAGYYARPDMDLIDLFIGSEGTLGIITQATLKLIPKPEKFISGILFFKSHEALLEFNAQVILLSDSNKDSLTEPNATSIEYFDKNSLTFLKPGYPNIPDSEGAIYFEQICTLETEDLLLEKWFNLAAEYGADLDNSWFAMTKKDEDFFKEFRHALPAAINEFLSRHKMKKISSDIAVPADRFTEMMNIYHNHLVPGTFKWLIFGHIGNHHLHMNILPHNDEEYKTGKEIYGHFIRSAIEMGGTVSAEHGIGKLKVPYLKMMFGEHGISEMKAVKRALDPDFILGTHTLFDPY